MADNVTLPSGTYATDDVGGVNYPRTKLSFGADGSASDVAANNPLPADVTASLKSGTVTRTFIPSSTNSGAILLANANRKGATIFNSDPNALLLDLSGGAASATRCQVRLTQYQTYELGSGYTGAITGVWEADGTGQADVVEFS